MDHEVASTTHAVERYLLGEMPSPERDAFEEHYFACTECAEGVRSGSVMVRQTTSTGASITTSRSIWKPAIVVGPPIAHTLDMQPKVARQPCECNLLLHFGRLAPSRTGGSGAGNASSGKVTSL